MRVKSHFAGDNCTLRVEITLVRVENTLESFEIILKRVVIADIFFSFLEGIITLKLYPTRILDYGCDDINNYVLRIGIYFLCLLFLN
jgi:hypothetical protein